MTNVNYINTLSKFLQRITTIEVKIKLVTRLGNLDCEEIRETVAFHSDLKIRKIRDEEY